MRNLWLIMVGKGDGNIFFNKPDTCRLEGRAEDTKLTIPTAFS